MPAYDFRCTKCESEFEIDRPFGATGSVKCPRCGSNRTEKIFSATGVVFKGSGFYLTDSRSSVSKDGAKEARGKGEEVKPAPDTAESKPSRDGDTPAKPEKKAEKPADTTNKTEKKAKT